MTGYDSDSSADDDTDFTITNVILGYASVEPSDDDISHIGGHPTWLDSNITPSAGLARCKVCNGYLSLMLQLNADLQQHFPQNTRRIHVWYCKNKTCSRKQGSVRVFREVKKPQTSRQVKSPEPAHTQQKPAVADLGSALFGGSPSPANGNINPFSQNASTQGGLSNPFSSLAATSSLAAKPPQQPVSEVQPPTETFAEKLSLNSKPSEIKASPTKEPWPETSVFPEPYPYFYLDAYAEELEPTPVVAETAPSSSRTQYDADDSGSAAAGKDTSDMNIDKTFQRFSDRLSQNPEQVLRYEFKGQPLLYSGTDGIASRFVVPHGKAGAVKGIPRCENCGAQRVFEFQLTPHLIFEVERNEAMSIEDGMEWGTIIVGTCTNNCGENGTVSFEEEWVGVQWEERIPKK